MEDAVFDEERDQVAARVAASQVAGAHRLAAERDLVGRVEGFVGERFGRGAAPVAGVEGVEQFAGALRRDDARAGREARVSVRVVAVIVRVHHDDGFATGEPLGLFADALALHPEGHRVHDHRAAFGAQHADVAAHSEQHGDVVGDALGVERRDLLIAVDRDARGDDEQAAADARIDEFLHARPPRPRRMR